MYRPELPSVRRYAGWLEDEVAGVRDFLEFVHKDAAAEAMGLLIPVDLGIVKDGIVVRTVVQVELLHEKDEVGVSGDCLGGVDVDSVAGAPEPEGGGLVEKNIAGEVGDDGCAPRSEGGDALVLFFQLVGGEGGQQGQDGGERVVGTAGRDHRP